MSRFLEVTLLRVVDINELLWVAVHEWEPGALYLHHDLVPLLVMPPPVAVTVIGYVASLVACVTSNVTMELPEPGAGTGLTLKPTVVPDGTPAAESVIAELKPPLTAMLRVEVPDRVCCTLNEAGEPEIAKSDPAVTVRFTVVFLVIPPPVAVTVIG